jgi:hypothetical protein
VHKLLQELQNNINRQFGNERLFNFSANKNLYITAQGPSVAGVVPSACAGIVPMSLDGYRGQPCTPTLDPAHPGQMTIEQATKSIERINRQLSWLQHHCLFLYDPALRDLSRLPLQSELRFIGQLRPMP